MRLATLTALTACLLLAGCADLPEKITGSFTNSATRSDRLVKSVGQVETTVKAASPVTHENGVWLASAPIKIDKQAMLPAAFNASATFDRSVGSLSEFAERITLRSGIAARVTPDALAASARAVGGNTGTVASPPPTTNGSRVPPLSPPSGLAGGFGANHSDMRIVYPSGTLKGLLDTAAARFGVSWKYADNAIQFFHTDTRTFQINAIPGDSAVSATVASGSTAGEGGGQDGSAAGGANANNSQNTAVKSQLSVFASIEKTIGAMLSSYGKVVASPATGSITVTDTPDSLSRIAHFVDTENKALSRQVMINVTVLGVTLDDSDSYGVNWNLVYGDLSRRYGIQNSFAGTPGSNAFSAAILATASSKLAGSSVVIEALSRQGRVRRETTASVVTLNNQPVPVQVAKQTSYLKSSQTTITANVGSSTTLNPGTVTSGFNMTILPHLLTNGTVMLQFSTDISSLRRMSEVSSNNSLIQTPELDTRNFLQRVAMRSGETLIVSGFEQVADDLDRNGVGTPRNFLLGGGFKAQAAKEVIVILITPIAMPGA
ncbi:PilN family type IVB pilus formation outer membrane protein [Noviherbaspirillum saxi]|uniref:PilN family type IVB pilus formation outer membrane protein n=1 Tax=Noviherbaspirillum saxi TaxID=2320863 RepID=A0A3A3FFL0_9BURK|nr:PilN family type IVB pilus formation outer membrane protein [Noviherbaspirillum saxi]RJF92121.1 PilN family type IVB pilus formation outer membrane protein [Noviherbaspirillum saxi]